MFPVKLFTVFLVAVMGINEIFCDDDVKIVSTNDGDVRGLRKSTFWKKVDYYSFRGIPYAEPPIGELRFKPPKPVKSWKPNALDAFEFGNTCIQLGEFMPNFYPMGEDCLFLNIYVPAAPNSTEKLPVLFFIHGGGFVEGYGNDNVYGPDFIIETDTILVTINYRLGILGFLSLNSPEYSGNMGLKDQQLALKWIHKNIEHFNGDKNKITIFGQSAGGASTHFHVLSATSRKYFHNAIAMSGSVLNFWATTEKNDHLDIAQKIAADFGKPTENYDELVEILLSADAETLNKYSTIIDIMERSIKLKFTPVVERLDAKQPFLTQEPKHLYENTDCDADIMFTFASAECVTLISKDMQGISNVNGLDKNFTIQLPFKALKLPTESDDYRQFAREIRKFYFGDDTINENKYNEYVALISDMNFAYFIDRSAKAHATKSKGKSFYSRFSVDSKLNVFKRAKPDLQLPGAAHCDDLCYLFFCGMGKPFYDEVFSNIDDEQSKISLQTIERMTGLFAKFARRSECETCSEIGFKPIQNDKINFVDVTNDGFKPGLGPNQGANALWWDIEQRVQKYIGIREAIKRDEL